jgi:hypothetical protein
MLIGMKAEGIIPANQSVMNSEHIHSHVYVSCSHRYFWVLITILAGMVLTPDFAAGFAFSLYSHVGNQDSKTAVDTDFSSAVTEMANADPSDATTIEKPEKKALGILDGLILSALSANDSPDLISLNARLANLGSQEHGFGESYRVLRLGGKPPVFALVADFGLDSPSAIRLYAEQGSTAHFVMAVEIDRFTQKDLFDDSLDLLTIPLPQQVSGSVFVTIAGRTDQLKTGIFTAWRFDGRQLIQLWTTDLISHSTFEMNGENLVLTYCHDPADQDSKTCQSMVREKYAYSIPDGKWRQVSSEPVPNPKD